MDLSMLLDELHWRAPGWLLLALQPVLILTLRHLRRRRSQHRFAAAALLPWLRLPGGTGAAGLRTYAHVSAWLLLALAAAGPRLPAPEPGQALHAGVDWVLAVDVSRSMTATDVAPSRLKRARIEILRLLAQLRGDRVGLIVYAGDAHLIAPPTHDTEALGRYLELLQPDLLPTRGSRPERALDLARTTLAAYPRSARAVLWVTDSAGDRAAAAAADRLAQDGIPLYIFGMGSAGGAIDAGTSTAGADRSVDVPLEASALAALARSGGGRYAGVADDDSDLQRLYRHGIATLARARPGAPDPAQIQWREFYPWLLLPALVLLAATLLPWRRQRGRAWLGAVALGIGIGTFHAPSGHAAEHAVEQQAFDAYRDSQFRTAADLYARLSGFDARLGEGASAYRLGDFPRALREFTNAVLKAGDDRSRAAALLNLGNTYFLTGDYANAVTTYQDALRYRPGFDAAQRNLALAEMIADAVQRQLAGSRPGRGRRSADAGQYDGPGPLTLGDQPQARPHPDTAPSGPEAEHRFSELIARGLRHARVAAPGADAASSSVPQGEPSPGAVARMQQLQQDPADLWRRIFQLQEGFQAPLQEPRSIPGVAPW